MRRLINHALLGVLLATGMWQAAADDLVMPGWTRPTQQGIESWGHPGGPADATHSRWTTLGPTGTIYSDYATWGAHVLTGPPPYPYPVVDRGGTGSGQPLQFTGRSFTHNYWAGLSPVGREGVAQLSGDLNFIIPNTPESHNLNKLMQVQVTWLPEVTGARPELHADTPGGLRISDWLQTDQILGDGWIHTTFEGSGFDRMPPLDGPFNPLGEQFTLSGNIYVDQVVIDTVCIPEPGQLALGAVMVVVGAGYAWRRYRWGR
jgi:hypothetical protein